MTSAKPKLRIFCPPANLMSGLDKFSEVTVRELRDHGVDCDCTALVPRSAGYVARRFLPNRLGRLFLKNMVWPKCLRKHLAELRPGDVVWINNTTAFGDPGASFESAVKRMGCRLIYHVLDNWFALDNKNLAKEARSRIPLADLVAVPTPDLRQVIRGLFPDCKVECFIEPVDMTRFSEKKKAEPADRYICWAGNRTNARMLLSLSEVLSDTCARHHVRLRTMSGLRIPREIRQLQKTVPCEWTSFSPAHEMSLYEKAILALAPLPDNEYTRCKGAFKVKAYMAGGVPVIADSVGFQGRLVKESGAGFAVLGRAHWRMALDELCSDTEKALLMGSAGRDFAFENFSHNAVVPDWAEKLKRFFPGLNGEANTQGGRG